jgi:hypothetical protein
MSQSENTSAPGGTNSKAASPMSKNWRLCVVAPNDACFAKLEIIVGVGRTGVQAKRPDPTKKAYALRGVLKRRFRGGGT